MWRPGRWLVMPVLGLVLGCTSSSPEGTTATTSLEELTTTLAGTTTTTESPVDLAGEWETERFVRLSGDVFQNIPEELQREAWTIVPQANCPGPDCTYRLGTTPLETEGGEIVMELRPESGGWVATTDWISACVDAETGEVSVAEASMVRGTYLVWVIDMEGETILEISFTWDGEPTPAAVAADCLIRAAEFETEAHRTGS
jgi:hypothetical protein